ncbi:Hypothetical protein R9X50_00339000 [Acrodontium crateriforme]|uniref:Uncharacterized protein n=1 Tax=Acrodontium crateriforme TaxID=150365 RepID=A0AAQ3M482_9PEZI|nr:Hypothetical protein R9X50_00339000 [Acrodontium crateriforme]
MHVAPPPDPRQLLPPLLACLPLSFVSPRPPPALLPLLSPMLRQRLNYLSTSTANGANDGWLHLLSWNSTKKSKLSDAVERMQLEPHPVSGEIEIEDGLPPQYRRLDQETLQARLRVEQFDLLPTYVWCENNEHGKTGPGWKLADLKGMEDLDEEDQWFDTPSEANDAVNSTSGGNAQKEEDDDDYWGAYDRTPSQTPAKNRSPAPPSMAASTVDRQRAQSELEYFARYSDEVQPALDAHDPDEDHAEIGQSSLTGDALMSAQARPLQQPEHDEPVDLPPLYSHQTSTNEHAVGANGGNENELSMPRPISPANSNSSVEKLEHEAAAMDVDRATLGIKQHISTDIKSLFRLAKSVGMDRKEFEGVVKRELEVLCLLDDE